MQVTRFHSPNISPHRYLGPIKLPFLRRISRIDSFVQNQRHCHQFPFSISWGQGYIIQHKIKIFSSMDEGSLGISSFDDWGNNVGSSDYMSFSSDGEDSDGEILLTPLNDVDLPRIKKQFVTAEDALTVSAHRLALLGRHKKYRITFGFVTNLGLIAFLSSFLAFVDWCAWRIVRQPLHTFYFMCPFIASAFLVACAGYVSVPILKRFNVRQKFKRKWPPRHSSKKGTPTVGGLFFVPIGIAVARFMSGSSPEVLGVLGVTLAFAAVGLLDDTISLLKYTSFGLSGGTRLILEVKTSR